MKNLIPPGAIGVIYKITFNGSSKKLYIGSSRRFSERIQSCMASASRLYENQPLPPSKLDPSFVNTYGR